MSRFGELKKQVRERLEEDLKCDGGTASYVDDEPGLYYPEVRFAYNAFQDLVGEGGMSPGRLTYRERVAWLDDHGYDRVEDYAARKFLHDCWSALDAERQRYLSDKIERD